MRRRRRLVLVVVAVAVGAGVALATFSGGPGSSGSPGPGAVTRLSSEGIGGVRIGSSKAQTVAALTRLFGPPTRRFVSSGCGSAVTEVAWRHLYAEFRLGTFTGFRYVAGSIQPWSAGRPSEASVRPRLATALGISIGSTLAQLRERYGRLTPVGTARWESSDGLVFYDNAARFPDPGGSRIDEIKFGTCGDF